MAKPVVVGDSGGVAVPNTRGRLAKAPTWLPRMPKAVLPPPPNPKRSPSPPPPQAPPKAVLPALQAGGPARPQPKKPPVARAGLAGRLLNPRSSGRSPNQKA